MSALPPGVTYRQLDHWTRVGLLHPLNGELPGSGRPRKWAETELEVARFIGELRAAGLELHVAARIARRFVDDGDLAVRLSARTELWRPNSAAYTQERQ